MNQSIVRNYQDVKANLAKWIKANDKYTNRDLMHRLGMVQSTYYLRIKNGDWTDSEVLTILETIEG